MISVEELCPNRIISSLSVLKDNKSSEIKASVLLMIEAMVHNEKLYKKETEWIWSMVLDFHDDQNQNVRSEAKKVTKTILEKYKNWKNDVVEFRPMTLEKIDRILKSMSMSTANSWI